MEREYFKTCKYYASQYISDLQHNVENRYQASVGPSQAIIQDEEKEIQDWSHLPACSAGTGSGLRVALSSILTLWEDPVNLTQMLIYIFTIMY